MSSRVEGRVQEFLTQTFRRTAYEFGSSLVKNTG